MQTAKLPAAVATAARANPAIEFVALDGEVSVVVLASAATSAKRSRAARFFEGLGTQKHLAVRFLDHDDVRKELLIRPSLRNRMQRSIVLHGDVDRSFPDRSHHGRSRGRPLGRPHPDLRLPTRRIMQKLAHRNHLDSVLLFGSAVRSDFRPDSDVDVLIRYRSGSGPSLQSLTAVERELERAFGRDVHLFREETLRADVEGSIRTEAVALI
jgi:predicted nucleotidyltransferase